MVFAFWLGFCGFGLLRVWVVGVVFSCWNGFGSLGFQVMSFVWVSLTGLDSGWGGLMVNLEFGVFVGLFYDFVGDYGLV